jgi:hypothetical protein
MAPRRLEWVFKRGKVLLMSRELARLDAQQSRKGKLGVLCCAGVPHARLVASAARPNQLLKPTCVGKPPLAVELQR